MYHSNSAQEAFSREKLREASMKTLSKQAAGAVRGGLNAASDPQDQLKSRLRSPWTSEQMPP
jgi:hypothetical protein